MWHEVFHAKNGRAFFDIFNVDMFIENALIVKTIAKSARVIFKSFLRKAAQRA